MWRAPRKPRPIVFLGAGGIVRHAHLPAYRAAGFTVSGVFDVRRASAEALARDFGIERVYDSLADAAHEREVVFDVAVPAEAILSVLRALPAGSTVLIQKPMGRDLREARRILALCRARRLAAAVNFQLRFSPNMLALSDALARGRLGAISDVEVRVCTLTPWSNWTFLEGIPRMEVLYHSIHYLDLVRALFGEPSTVKCVAAPDPAYPGYSDTRSTILLRHANGPRVVITTLHSHEFGAGQAMSQIKIEGERAAAVATMGVNLDYPRGAPDTLSFARRQSDWRPVALRGSWFVEAFAGTMSNLQRFAAGEDQVLVTRVDDAVRTMALVEACYRSSRHPGTKVPSTE